MATSKKSNRHRPGTLLRATVISALAPVLAVVLTACNGDGTSTAAPAGGKTTTAGSAGSAQTASPSAGAKPADQSTTGTGNAGSSQSAAPQPAPSAPAPADPIASASTDGDDGCDHKMPISPDEVAVYRYTPEGGSLSLIVKYGNWGCAPADSDGAPFETVGKETYMPMDQAAYITVTTPIVESTENQHIGVQEFLDWLDANPNSGLVFQYHLGADGVIDRLDEEFTP
ncbi:hypothetical protein [Streptomyces sp. NBC_00582]|uniref:hypothetical protein n=1 Tax=Streptomyces sp. NBC_00582 TaxID=2975783 RepID=UPI0010E6862B|nr:hypothetical protein [Streptomyces sp. NBC_00582]WUB59317.1 hypothetical protein OG852_02285 [Streptomyces sp. NBC_00582]